MSSTNWSRLTVSALAWGGNADMTERIGEEAGSPVVAQELLHHFAALGEGALHDFDENRNQFRREWLVGPAAELDAGGIDIGRREKGAGGDFEAVARLVAELDEERELAVVLGIGGSLNALDHFELERGDEAFGTLGSEGEFHQHGRTDRVGEIGDEFPGGPIAILLLAKIIQGIRVEELEIAGGLETITEQSDEALILLDGEDVSAGFQEDFGERAEARANFEDLIRGGEFGESGDALDLVAVVQKILAERFGEVDLVTAEEVAHFRKLHRAAISSWSAVTLVRS